MNCRRFATAAAAFSFSIFGLPASAWTPDDASKVDAVVNRMLKATQAPSAVVAVIQDDVVVYRKAFGLADVKANRPMSADAMFEIGSLTKQMTAVAVLQLASAGKLALDDDVTKYIREYPAAAGVTIRQLLHQVSGLPDFALTPQFAENATKQPTDFAGLLDAMKTLPRDFSPGERWKYSNTNYLLLGQIVQRVGGSDFDHFLANSVLRPAGMRNVTTLREFPPMKATGYSKEGGHLVPAATFQNSWIGAAGNVVSNVDDLIAWNRTLTCDRWLPAMRVSARLNDGTESGYGFGLYIDRQAGEPRIWHGGGTLGFSSSDMLYPNEKMWIIALVNDGDINASVMTASIYDELHDVRHEPASGESSALTSKARTWLHHIRLGELPSDEVSPGLYALLTKDGGRRYRTLQSRLDVYGRPEAVIYEGTVANIYNYGVRYGAQWLRLSMGVDADGKLDTLNLIPE